MAFIGFPFTAFQTQRRSYFRSRVGLCLACACRLRMSLFRQPNTSCSTQETRTLHVYTRDGAQARGLSRLRAQCTAPEPISALARVRDESPRAIAISGRGEARRRPVPRRSAGSAQCPMSTRRALEFLRSGEVDAWRWGLLGGRASYPLRRPRRCRASAKARNPKSCHRPPEQQGKGSSHRCAAIGEHGAMRRRTIRLPRRGDKIPVDVRRICNHALRRTLCVWESHPCPTSPEPA